MSGAELTAAIEEEMAGRWKPRPGSMYPLLKSLLQDGLTQEVPVEDGRTRKYELTPAGLKFLETQVNQSGELQEKIELGFVPPPFPFLQDAPPGLKTLFSAFRIIGVVLQGKPSPEVLKQLEQAVERFANELEEIRKKMEKSET